VLKLFDYPQRFAEQIFGRIETALRIRVAGGADSHGAMRVGCLHVQSADSRASKGPDIPELAPRFLLSSDRQLVDAGKAQPYEQAQLAHSRTEGEFIVSFATPGGWVGLTKDVLTDVLGAGHRAKIVGIPREAAEVLRLMCPGLVSLADGAASSQEAGQIV
jgi:hypothetical protein